MGSMKMYFLFKMVIFQSAMLVLGSVNGGVKQTGGR